MYNNIIEKIKSDKNEIINIGLFTHKEPDYDAVCSTLTLGNYLKSVLGNKVKIFSIIEKYDLNLNINSELEVYDESLNINLDYGIVLDVNEKDRVYGLSIFNNIDETNRYLFDHHKYNREELDVPENQKLVLSNCSSTCEVIGLDILQDNIIDEYNAYNLFLGITSDTAGFTRQVGELTNKLIKLLGLNEEVKNKIIEGVIDFTPTQKELYDSILEEKSDFTNLILYKLKLTVDESDKLKELKNKFIEEKITPLDLDKISILFVECGDAVFLKIRKNEKSNLDILTLAEKCNGGGHSNRCAGRFYNTTYEEVLEYVLLNYKLLNKNKIKEK